MVSFHIWQVLYNTLNVYILCIFCMVNDHWHRKKMGRVFIARKQFIALQNYIHWIQSLLFELSMICMGSKECTIKKSR